MGEELAKINNNVHHPHPHRHASYKCPGYFFHFAYFSKHSTVNGSPRKHLASTKITAKMKPRATVTNIIKSIDGWCVMLVSVFGVSYWCGGLACN